MATKPFIISFYSSISATHYYRLVDKEEIFASPYSSQLGLGLLKIILGGLDINTEGHINIAKMLNNIATILVILIVMISVFTSGICFDIVNQSVSK